MRRANRVRRRRVGVVAALWLALGGACASAPTPPRISPVTELPTGRVQAGKFVWVDLVTHDVAAAKSFYAALFGWTFDGTDDGYVRVLVDGTPIAGIVDIRRPEGWERESGWVGNLSVADVDRAAEVVALHGGVVERGPLEAPARGRIALVRDPDGAHLLLVRASSGDPLDEEPLLHRFFWRELWTHDVSGAISFYTAFAGYESETIDFRNQAYRVLRTGGVPRAGVLEAPPEVDTQWLPYVRVEDPVAVAARASELGARVVLQDEDAAILVDPTGAPIGVQSWSGREADER